MSKTTKKTAPAKTAKATPAVEKKRPAKQLNSKQMNEVLSPVIDESIAQGDLKKVDNQAVVADQPKKRTTAKPGYRQMNIPLLESEIEQINVLRKLREVPRGSTKEFAISLQNWIVEAVAEKLARDNAANNITPAKV